MVHRWRPAVDGFAAHHQQDAVREHVECDSFIVAIDEPASRRASLRNTNTAAV
jgi:hypothetical protein